jgi:phosphoribosylformimino-5-aminoimidazole carboxamide ribonucleotide (ProFAR) isomerase
MDLLYRITGCNVHDYDEAHRVAQLATTATAGLTATADLTQQEPQKTTCDSVIVGENLVGLATVSAEGVYCVENPGGGFNALCLD